MSLEDPIKGKILKFPSKPDASAPENDPRFQEALLNCYRFKLFEKKFGKGFYEKYGTYDLHKGVWNADSLENDPEIVAFRDELDAYQNLDDLKEFAKQKNLKLTARDEKAIRKEAFVDYSQDIYSD